MKSALLLSLVRAEIISDAILDDPPHSGYNWFFRVLMLIVVSRCNYPSIEHWKIDPKGKLVGGWEECSKLANRGLSPLLALDSKIDLLIVSTYSG